MLFILITDRNEGSKMPKYLVTEIVTYVVAQAENADDACNQICGDSERDKLCNGVQDRYAVEFEE